MPSIRQKERTLLTKNPSKNFKSYKPFVFVSNTSQHFFDTTKITFVIGYTKFAFFLFLIAKLEEKKVLSKSFQSFFA